MLGWQRDVLLAVVCLVAFRFALFHVGCSSSSSGMGTRVLSFLSSPSSSSSHPSSSVSSSLSSKDRTPSGDVDPGQLALDEVVGSDEELGVPCRGAWPCRCRSRPRPGRQSRRPRGWPGTRSCRGCARPTSARLRPWRSGPGHPCPTAAGGSGASASSGASNAISYVPGDDQRGRLRHLLALLPVHVRPRLAALLLGIRHGQAPLLVKRSDARGHGQLSGVDRQRGFVALLLLLLLLAAAAAAAAVVAVVVVQLWVPDASSPKGSWGFTLKGSCARPIDPGCPGDHFPGSRGTGGARAGGTQPCRAEG